MPQPCVLVLTGAFPGGLGFFLVAPAFYHWKGHGCCGRLGFFLVLFGFSVRGTDSPRLVPLADGRAGVGNTTEVALHVYKPRLRVD